MVKENELIESVDLAYDGVVILFRDGRLLVIPNEVLNYFTKVETINIQKK